MPQRLIHPSLVDNWQVKMYAAGVGGVLLESLGRIYGQLFDSDPLLVVLCITLLALDAVTGIGAAIKRGERVSSKGLRRTGWKVIEYTAIGACAIMIANAFADRWAHYLTDGIDDAALLYIALTEALSVIENVTGSRAAAMRVLRKIVFIRDEGPGGALTVEEIVTKKPVAADAVSEEMPSVPSSPEGPTPAP